METENSEKYIRIKKTTLAIIALVLLAGLTGWWIGRSSDNVSRNNQTNNTRSGNSTNPPADNSTSDSSLKSLVSYTLPDGWKETTCPESPNSIFFIPNEETKVDCNANPSAPVKLSIDAANSKDCNQLQSVQNVSKHICISEYINGDRSLKTETVYNNRSSYKKDTTVHAYYIDTGKDVIKVEYSHDPDDNKYQSGFEELAKSVKAKN